MLRETKNDDTVESESDDDNDDSDDDSDDDDDINGGGKILKDVKTNSWIFGKYRISCL